MNFRRFCTRRTSSARRLTLVLLGITAIAVPAVASAAKPPPNNNQQLSIAANPKTVVFGKTVAITGRLRASSGSSAGQGIMLQVNAYPFAGYVNGATTSTDANGNYALTAKPLVNTRYRVQTTTITPAQTSGEITATVSPRISLSLSDRTPSAGQSVRFSGFVWPAHDGASAQLQRMTSTGAWRTVARVTLKDSGDTRSNFGRRMRVRRTAMYRVQLPADVDHGAGLSPTRTASVH